MHVLALSTIVGGNDDGVVDGEAASKCGTSDVGGCSVGLLVVGAAADDGVAGATAVGVDGGVVSVTDGDDAGSIELRLH